MVIMILGIGMVALPAGMLASRFSEVMQRQRDLFRRFVEEALEAGDGVPEERVEQRRLKSFIGRTEASAIIANCIAEFEQPLNYCPSCGAKLPGRRAE